MNSFGSSKCSDSTIRCAPSDAASVQRSNGLIPGPAETGTGANTTFAADDGTLNQGNTYSYGASGSSERALGAIQSGSLISTLGAEFKNDTGGTITSLTISYTGEEWRLGATGRTDRLDFQFSTDASGLADGTWTDVDALDFTTPNTVGPAGKINGNGTGNFTALGTTINGLNIPAGATFWIRWSDFNATGADDGLAVDVFSLSAGGVAALPTLTVNDVSQAEGNAGTKTFTFTVSLSVPSASDVTFNIATNDGTATTADNDYVAKNLTSQTITAGNTSYNFDVTVNGDTNSETDETFTVDISNVVGVNVGDAQGLAPDYGLGDAPPALCQDPGESGLGALHPG